MFKFGWMDKEEVRKVINVIKDVFNVIVVEFVLIDVNKGLISEMWVLKKLREFVMRIMLVYQLVQVWEEKEDLFEKLKKFKEFYDMGVISQEEYEEKRKKLLEEI